MLTLYYGYCLCAEGTDFLLKALTSRLYTTCASLILQITPNRVLLRLGGSCVTSCPRVTTMLCHMDRRFYGFYGCACCNKTSLSLGDDQLRDFAGLTALLKTGRWCCPLLSVTRGSCKHRTLKHATISLVTCSGYTESALTCVLLLTSVEMPAVSR